MLNILFWYADGVGDASDNPSLKDRQIILWRSINLVLNFAIQLVRPPHAKLFTPITSSGYRMELGLANVELWRSLV